MRRVVKGVVKGGDPEQTAERERAIYECERAGQIDRGFWTPLHGPADKAPRGEYFLDLFYFIFYIPDLGIFETRKWINKSGGAPSHKRPNSQQ